MEPDDYPAFLNPPVKGAQGKKRKKEAKNSVTDET